MSPFDAENAHTRHEVIVSEDAGAGALSAGLVGGALCEVLYLDKVGLAMMLVRPSSPKFGEASSSTRSLFR